MHRSSTVVACVVAILICPAIARAQSPQTSLKDEPKTDPPRGRALIPFLEGTDVFFTPFGDTKFEADIFPHLIVTQTFGDVLNYRGLLGLQRQEDAEALADFKRFGWAISGTPAVRIRMFRADSDPVRTPSYMPRVNVQALFATGVKSTACRSEALRNTARCRDAHVRDPEAAPEIGIWEVHSIVGHHSNGQDGCFYTNEVGHGENCHVPPGVAATPQVINRQDGSFSTNYVKGGFNYRRNRIDTDTLTGDQDLQADFEWTVGAEVEQHFHQDPHIVDTFGRTRVTMVAGLAGRPSNKSSQWWDQQHAYTCEARRDIRASLKYIPGRPDGLRPYALTIQASCFPSSQGGWGVFARFYEGQDYYNIGFMDDIKRFQIGATFNQDGFFHFYRPKPKR